jgi:hypothetical protein
VPGKTTIPESTRPGLRASRSTCASAVSQEVLAPFGVARSLSPNRVDTAGRARGLCGAPDGARGRRAESLALHRLDPDGWLVQSSTDTNPIQSPAAQRRAESANFKPLSPRSGPPGLSLAKPCPLDTRLLMGGTFSKSMPENPLEGSPFGERLRSSLGKQLAVDSSGRRRSQWHCTAGSIFTQPTVGQRCWTGIVG